MGNSFNAVVTLGRDAEKKYTPSGTAVLSFTAANNIGYNDKKSTMWLRCTIFGKRAESNLVDYLKKGQQVWVSGILSLREYTGKDGTAKQSLELNLSELSLVGGMKQESREPGSDDNFDDDIAF